LAGNEGKPLCEAEAYDPARNTWTALPNMTVPLCSCSFTVLDERLHVIGGLTVGGPSASLQVLSLNWAPADSFYSVSFSVYCMCFAVFFYAAALRECRCC